MRELLRYAINDDREFVGGDMQKETDEEQLNSESDFMFDRGIPERCSEHWAFKELLFKVGFRAYVSRRMTFDRAEYPVA